ncbi:MAG: DUF2163 domain-containing protein [Hydrogenophaga sp.]|uniref:DUF2163 domain-containing protein n=1 Tax=Hydrogenophaga sp. TaxID=1904254 RepID=UPI002734281C|nr:DUF2163 domain-containing protein [Hydrogenophaga sp.]MDP3625013.1 DUF2163 domain-containing protein [Hydrogenophaga sp.]
MPKTIPAALQAHYDTGHICVAPAVLIQRADGQLRGFTLRSKPLVMDLSPWDGGNWNLSAETAFEFEAAGGMEAFVIESTAGFEVDETMLVTLNNGDLFTEEDILAKRWAGARFRIFLYRWDVEAPTIEDDVETLKVGTLGNLQPSSTTVKAELHCLKRLLQLPVGIVTQPNCRVRVFSQGPGQCNKDPTGFVHSLTVTGVTDKRVFTCSGAGQAADYFGYGFVAFDTGLNAGLSMQVSTFVAGVFSLVAPMIFNIQVGDTLTATAGCRGRRDEDCIAKFDNIENLQAEPDFPSRDQVVSGVSP